MALTLAELAARMREIDTCLLCTRSSAGMEARPMSNNQDVEFGATSWFFTGSDTGMVEQLEADPHVLITYTGADHLWVSLSGTVTLHSDRALMTEHWDEELQRWFELGVDTPGLRLLEVQASHVRYWSFTDGDGEIALGRS